MTYRALAFLLLVAAGACSETIPMADFSPIVDMTATANDEAPPPDAAVPVDMAVPVDNAAPVDTAVAPDTATPPDTAVAADMATPPDTATPADMTLPPDLVPAVDLAALPDLALPDLAPRTWSVTVAPGGALMFSPTMLTIKAGDTVTWTWASSGHTVTSGNSGTCTPDNTFCSPNDQSCSTGTVSSVGATYSHTFTTAGTFTYFCKPHCFAGMTGSIVVQ